MKFFLPKTVIVATIFFITFSAHAQKKDEHVPGFDQTISAFTEKAFVIFLNDDATNGQGSSPIALPGIDITEYWLKSETLKLATDMSIQYGFVPTNVTSLASHSISAYLSDAQVQALRKDHRVKDISSAGNPSFKDESGGTKTIDNASLTLKASTTPLWHDAVTSLGITSWGVAAMGGTRVAPATAVPIYLVDAGVGLHSDLLNVTARLSPNVPIIKNQNGIGCYAHATGVAGIISATTNMYLYPKASYGLYQAAPIVSISIGKTYIEKDGFCLDSNTSDSSAFKTLLLGGLDEAYRQISLSGKMGIVNISLNGPAFADVNVRSAIKKLATPSGSYKGAFVSQAAGNQGEDACLDAYAPSNNMADTSDGIMVVGAFDEYGNRVVDINADIPGALEAGSNYGNCVDIWAPGKRLYIPWAADKFVDNNGNLIVQSGAINYNGHIYLDGTSFAAPLVAAAASYVATTYNLTTPQAVEQTLRSLIKYIGENDKNRSMYAIDLTTVVPAPVVTWLVDGQNVNGSAMEKQKGQPFTFEFKSLNTGWCDLSATYNGAPWYTVNSSGGIGTGYNWGTVRLTENSLNDVVLTYTVTCKNAVNASATAKVTMTQKSPKVTWYTRPRGYIGSYEIPRNTIRYVYNTPYSMAFYGDNVNSCALNAYTNGLFWYSADSSILKTQYYWPEQDMWDGGSNTLTAWYITCTNAYGYSDTNWTAVQK